MATASVGAFVNDATRASVVAAMGESTTGGVDEVGEKVGVEDTVELEATGASTTAGGKVGDPGVVKSVEDTGTAVLSPSGDSASTSAAMLIEPVFCVWKPRYISLFSFSALDINDVLYALLLLVVNPSGRSTAVVPILDVLTPCLNNLVAFPEGRGT